MRRQKQAFKIYYVAIENNSLNIRKSRKNSMFQYMENLIFEYRKIDALNG